jgi:hypothetical protein
MTTSRQPHDDDILDLASLDRGPDGPEPASLPGDEEDGYLDLEALAEDYAAPNLVSGRWHLCCICGCNQVDAENGFDTCPLCLASQ